MTLDANCNGVGTWQEMPALIEARADHACQYLQYQWDKGIMCAGGYGNEAWKETVEFYNLAKGCYRIILSEISIIQK